MGFGDFLKSAWDKVKGTASKAWDSVKTGASKIWSGIKSGAETVAKTAKKVGGFVKDTAGKAIDKVEDVGKTLYNDAKSFANRGFDILGSPFTMIALAAGGIAVAMVASKV